MSYVTSLPKPPLIYHFSFPSALFHVLLLTMRRICVTLLAHIFLTPTSCNMNLGPLSPLLPAKRVRLDNPVFRMAGRASSQTIRTSIRKFISFPHSLLIHPPSLISRMSWMANSMYVYALFCFVKTLYWHRNFDQWNSGWPIEVTTSFAQKVLSQATSSGNTTNTTQPHSLLNLVTHSALVESVEETLSAEVNSTLNKLQLALSQFIGATQTDTQYLDSLAALPNNILQARDGEPSTPRVYMAAVSPCFFTHYGPNSFNKNVCFCLILFISSAWLACHVLVYLSVWSTLILEEMGINHQSSRSN